MTRVREKCSKERKVDSQNSFLSGMDTLTLCLDRKHSISSMFSRSATVSDDTGAVQVHSWTQVHFGSAQSPIQMTSTYFQGQSNVSLLHMLWDNKRQILGSKQTTQIRTEGTEIRSNLRAQYDQTTFRIWLFFKMQPLFYLKEHVLTIILVIHNISSSSLFICHSNHIYLVEQWNNIAFLRTKVQEK